MDFSVFQKIHTSHLIKLKCLGGIWTSIFARGASSANRSFLPISHCSPCENKWNAPSFHGGCFCLWKWLLIAEVLFRCHPFSLLKLLEGVSSQNIKIFCQYLFSLKAKETFFFLFLSFFFFAVHQSYGLLIAIPVLLFSIWQQVVVSKIIDVSFDYFNWGISFQCDGMGQVLWRNRLRSAFRQGIKDICMLILSIPLKLTSSKPTFDKFLHMGLECFWAFLLTIYMNTMLDFCWWWRTVLVLWPSIPISKPFDERAAVSLLRKHILLQKWKQCFYYIKYFYSIVTGSLKWYL